MPSLPYLRLAPIPIPIPLPTPPPPPPPPLPPPLPLPTPIYRYLLILIPITTPEPPPLVPPLSTPQNHIVPQQHLISPPPTKDCHNAPHQWRNRQAKSHSRHHDLRVCIQDAPLGPPSPPPLTSARPDESTGARITSLDDYKSCLDHFQSRGYNEIDTARVYVGGKQEAWTREAGWKNRGLMLATKWYPHTPYVEPGSVDQDNCSPSHRDI